MGWTLFPTDGLSEDPNAQYVIEYTTRPPLQDAGTRRRTYATGRAAVRAAQKAIRDSHGVVLRTRKRSGWRFW